MGLTLQWISGAAILGLFGVSLWNVLAESSRIQDLIGVVGIVIATRLGAEWLELRRQICAARKRELDLRDREEARRISRDRWGDWHDLNHQ